jgi:hypothetical protein
MKLKELKKGDLFALKPHGEKHVTDSQVYIKGEYDRTEKKYDCGRCDDISYSRYFDGNKTVYTDFIF